MAEPVVNSANDHDVRETVAPSASLQFAKGGSTVLRRENDGTVTVVSLGPVWTPVLTRQPDGTVTVGAT